MSLAYVPFLTSEKAYPVLINTGCSMKMVYVCVELYTSLAGRTGYLMCQAVALEWLHMVHSTTAWQVGLGS